MAIVKRVDSELDLWKPDNGDLIFQVLKNDTEDVKNFVKSKV